MLHNNIEGFTVYTTDLKGASKVEAYSTFIIGIRQTYVEYDPPYVPIVLQQSKRIPFFFHVVHKAILASFSQQCQYGVCPLYRKIAWPIICMNLCH